MDVAMKLYCQGAWRYLSVRLCVVWLGTMANSLVWAAESSLEAAFIYRLAQFSEWPAKQPWTYCVVGDTDVANALTALLGNKQPVIEPTSAAAARACHVLFLGKQLKNAADWQPLLNNPQLLTIAANAELYQLGAVFGLIQEPHQLAFRVNLSMARQRGYQLNARMLRLAKEIY